MIRKAFQKVQKRQHRRYLWVLGALAVAGLAAAGYAWHVHSQLRDQQAQAEQTF